ncbi:MAG: ABC transporter permease subunit [Spirochaetaceae bacterium]|jgi:NitT/TauT family transport system permease protein|nr:ABC transporter permease subunit [Spirochaetaceae bacterium]
MSAARSGHPLSFFAGLACFFLIWQIGAWFTGSEIILPAPLSVIEKLFALIKTERFLSAFAASSVRLLAGLLISAPLGILAGLAAALDKRIAAFLRPFFSVIAATPVMSVILIAFLAFGSEKTPVFTVFLMVFPVMAANTMAGVKAVDPNLIELFKVYNLGGIEKLRFLYIPSLIPFLTAGLHSGLSLGWKVLVAAEVLVQPVSGLGSGMQMAKARLETPELFAWTAATVIAAALSALLLEFIVSPKKRR